MQLPQFHEGELAVQKRAGEDAIAQRNGGAIQNKIVGGALTFIRQQPMVVLATEDAEERLWTSILFGKPGFLQPSSDAKQLAIAVPTSTRSAMDLLWSNIEFNPRIGALIVELSTRRRLRVNGDAVLDKSELTIHVQESYPLCPKYIQKRTVRLEGEPASELGTDIAEALSLGEDQIDTVKRSDTFFVSSTHRTRGPDASHRGGFSGFVQVVGTNTLRIPDYPGNSMFNTFGNLLINPRAGLIFPDFQRRVLLQLSGSAEVLWDQPDTEEETGGSRRLWLFHSERWIESAMPSGVVSELLEYSPFNPSVAK